jgi:hypothetical protein
MSEAGVAMRRNSPETKPTPFHCRDEVIASSTPTSNGVVDQPKRRRDGRGNSKISADFDSLKTVVLFSAAGLLLCLLAANYGLNYGAF